MQLSVASAADLGVQIINGPDDEAAEPTELDDMKLNEPVEIPGFGSVTIVDVGFVDSITYNRREWNEWGSGFAPQPKFESGLDAEYFLLRLDVLNATAKPVDYMKDLSVTVTYKEVYIYTGFVYQYNYDQSKDIVKSVGTNAIGMFYIGHYAIGCTLPNTVVTDKASPLKIVIQLGEHEITYNIRK